MRLLLLSVVASMFVACSAAPPTAPSPWLGQDPWTAGYAGATGLSSPAVQDAQSSQEAPAAEEPATPSHGFGHRLLWWIPNRISDVLDIVRARVRLGPGLSLGARATEFVDFYLGVHTSIFVGIPGPRGTPSFNWPFGWDNRAGMELSVADATAEGGTYYGWLEFGAGFQALIVGVEVGVDPWEIVDFALGILTIDLEGDDL